MTNEEMIETIAEILANDFGGLVKFQDVLLIKTSPYTELARIYGAAVNLYDMRQVWLLDNNGEWYTVNIADRNIEYVVSSVLQRLKLLRTLTNA